MVTKTQSRQQQSFKGIKSKLMAAVCMLLVSAIMMVSSTYAWFTLSTAPEVTGITTAVGANGNLEMALQPISGDLTKIGSEAGDSTKAVTVRNTTWGNIVELGDDSYGLKDITLNPSKMQLNADGTIATVILQAPSYGSDGRVASLVDTYTGVNQGSKGFQEYIVDASAAGVTGDTNKAYGVRAIGTSSGMSSRELAYRSAMSSANTYKDKAKSTASTSLNTNGETLAGIAIAKATETDPKFTYEQVKAILTAVNDLVGYDTTTGEGESATTVHTNGALDYIAEAMKYTIIANAISASTDEAYAALKTEMEALTLTDILANTDKYSAYVTSDVASYNTTLQGSITNAKAAQTALTTKLAGGTSESTYEWSDFSESLHKILNTESMTINDFAVNDLLKKDDDGNYVNVSALVNSAFGGDGIKMTLATGSGVYADISDFCGDYSAGITLSGIKYNGITAPDMPATMTTKTTHDPVYLTNLISALNFSSTEDTGSKALSDFYGYIIDLAFRTNVADSDLMLQTDAVDRIYEDGSNSSTMGHGSSMTFSTTDNSFGAAGVKSLMSKIRIVFFDTKTQEIIGYARLDASSTTQIGNEVTMKMMMTDAKGTAIGSDKIMDLTQNQTTALSVLVYLDGEAITNADVANASQSMSGSMNIQFSSSATLVPMEYTNLMTDTGSIEEDDEEKQTTTTLENVSSADSTNYTVSNATYASGVVGFTLTDSSSNPITSGTVKVTIGGTDYTATFTNKAWVANVSTAPVEAKTEIIVTYTAA